MANMNAALRADLLEIRALTTDRDGNEVLVGLTLEETNFYLEYLSARREGKHTTREDGDRYVQLHEKHELQRLAVLGAEMQLRNEGPMRH